MSEQKRTMTIKNALTRLKTIGGQLSHIIEDVDKHAAINDRKKSFLGNMNLPNDAEGLKRNHEEAKAYFQSQLQKFEDLLKEYSKLKLAIERANVTTYITVAGTRMTLREALLWKESRHNEGLLRHVHDLLQAYRRSVKRATIEIDSYNAQFKSDKIGEEAKTLLMADIACLVDPKRMDEYARKAEEFANEVDGALDAAIVTTLIEIED